MTTVADYKKAAAEAEKLYKVYLQKRAAAMKAQKQEEKAEDAWLAACRMRQDVFEMFKATNKV